MVQTYSVETITPVEDGQWHRYATSVGSGRDGADVVGIVLAESGTVVDVRNYQAELTADEPGEIQPIDSGQWYSTTNENTVDARGIVTERPGTPIVAEGLQLEGARTNEVPNTDLTNAAWGHPDCTVEFHTSIPAPDGSMTAHHVVETSAGARANTGVTLAAGEAQSIWARTVTGTGQACLLNYNLEAGQQTVTLTDEWQRFDAPKGATSTAYYWAFDGRHPDHDLTEFLLWGPQSEAAAFPSSFIPSSFASTTRAATLCKAPFISTPLPDGGLVNDFCGQLVVDIASASPAALSGLLLLSGDSSNTFEIYVNTNQNISMRQRVAGASTVIDHVDGALEKMLDIRFRKSSSTGLTVWLNGAPLTNANTDDFAVPLDDIELNEDRNNNLYFGIYKKFYVYPGALSDEEIEAWSND